MQRLYRLILWSIIVPEEEMRKPKINNPWYDYDALCNNSFKHFTVIQIQCYCVTAWLNLCLEISGDN